MALRTKIKSLFISRKNDDVGQPQYGVDSRTIEIWAQQVLDYLNNNGIIEITSTGGTVTITDPFGPVTNLEAAGAGGYASLTGPGETVTPGALTQAGDLTVDGTLDVNGSSQLSAPSGDQLLEAGAGASFGSVWVNGTSIFRDLGTVSFQGTGNSNSFQPVVQFVFLLSAPAFAVGNATYAFLAGATGHIYYNPGGSSWTLLV